jgi:hypothetical protein
MNTISWEWPLSQRFPTQPLRTAYVPSKMAKAVFFTINKRPPKPTPVDIRHALLVCCLAAEIHDTDVAVRQAAWRMMCRAGDSYTDASMWALVKSTRARIFVYRILDEVEMPDEIPKRKRKRKKKK